MNAPAGAERELDVPASRVEAWIDGFAARHGGLVECLPESGGEPGDAGIRLRAADGSQARVTPLVPPLTAPATVAALLDAVARPRPVAVLLVRRGGYGCAVVQGGALAVAKAGRRHVQGRTAAGGWSQQRFARRREKQAAELTSAVVETVSRLLLPLAGTVTALAAGGDRLLLRDVLADARLSPLTGLPRIALRNVPDPTGRYLATLPDLLAGVRVRLQEAVPEA